MFVSNFPETTVLFAWSKVLTRPAGSTAALYVLQKLHVWRHRNGELWWAEFDSEWQSKKGIVWVCKCWCCCWWCCCCCCCCCCCWEHDDNPPELVVAYFQTNPPTKHHGIYWLQQETSDLINRMAEGFTARDVVWKKHVMAKLGLEPRTSPPEKTAQSCANKQWQTRCISIFNSGRDRW